MSVCILMLAFVSAPALALCPIVDIERRVETIAQATATSTDAVREAAYRRDVASAWPAVFVPPVIRSMSPAMFDDAVIKSLAQERNDGTRRAADAALRWQVERTEALFARTFAEFRCDFPIYLTDSLGSFDGAGRTVAGRPALLFGVDQVAGETMLSLPVFVSHELFHRYHSQVGGFSDDPGDRQPIWRTLWAEGLATYASYRLTPTSTVGQALLSDDLATAAAPKTAVLARGILDALDRPDQATYAKYFLSGAPARDRCGVPPRSGYFLGFLVAQAIGRSRTLDQMAHLRGPRLLDRIKAVLNEMSGKETGNCR